MKRTITNTIAALAVVAGIVIGAACQGILAFLGALALGWTGFVTLINRNTDWIWNE